MRANARKLKEDALEACPVSRSGAGSPASLAGPQTAPLCSGLAAPRDNVHTVRTQARE